MTAEKVEQQQGNGTGDRETVDSGWRGDLDDDCYLERYGMMAHVECMGRGYWWFAVSKDTPNGPGKFIDLYNTADNLVVVKLTTGKMARAAAECVLELLNQRNGV